MGSRGECLYRHITILLPVIHYVYCDILRTVLEGLHIPSSMAECEKSSPTVGTVRQKLDDLIDNGKNKTNIYCQRCWSLVLSPRNATIVKKEFFLPYMYKKNEAQPSDGEVLTDFWLVTDMFIFDNVGFTNTVDSIKYLICADCDTGPIGVQNISDRSSYYVAVERVNHE